jgi:hypothetical protein
VHGPALAFYGRSGADLTRGCWEELDNAVFDELCEFFGQGVRPTQGDIQRLVAKFKKGTCGGAPGAAAGCSGQGLGIKGGAAEGCCISGQEGERQAAGRGISWAADPLQPFPRNLAAGHFKYADRGAEDEDVNKDDGETLAAAT